MEFTTNKSTTSTSIKDSFKNQGETKTSGAKKTHTSDTHNLDTVMTNLKIASGETNSISINKKIHPLLLNFATSGGYETSNDDLLLLEQNHICSSLGVPFLVISKDTFITGHKPLIDTTKYNKFLALVLKSVKAQQGEIILADFEGEMPGFGGDLSCAQFMPTRVIENSLVTKCTSNANECLLCSPHTAGLIVDLRDTGGIMITQLIMSDVAFTKLIWGATGDLTSLRYQRSLGNIRAKNVVDVQRGFSSPGRLLGMGTAISRCPRKFIQGLPSKDQGHDWSPRAQNRRCVPLPLSQSFAKYAMDDLHRIDAILSCLRPSGNSYKSALRVTDVFLAELENPSGAILQIQNELGYFARKYGIQKRIKAVEINRVLVHIKNAFEGRLSIRQKQIIEQALQRVTRATSVTVPNDLSWF